MLAALSSALVSSVMPSVALAAGTTASDCGWRSSRVSIDRGNATVLALTASGVLTASGKPSGVRFVIFASITFVSPVCARPTIAPGAECEPPCTVMDEVVTTL